MIISFMWGKISEVSLKEMSACFHKACLLNRSEYWSELPFPSPEDLPGPGMKPASPALELDFFTTESQGVDE